MARPQQPELARSGKTDLVPERTETVLGAAAPPTSKGRTGPVPAENLPGHHPEEEQDKPDLDAFVAKLQGDGRPDPEQAEPAAARPAATAKPARAAAKPPAAKQAATKQPAAKQPGAKRPTAKQPAAKQPAAKQPAAKQPAAKQPAAKQSAAKQPAANDGRSGHDGVVWPESAPASEKPGPLGRSVEPPMVTMALMPLRVTVRSLERLEQRLTAYWRQKAS